MTPARIALLPDRGVVHVTGEDAEKFLQGLVTNDISGPAAAQPKTVPAAVHAGLLSPQGKILFEFFVVGLGGGLLLETARDRIPDLIKRLRMYRLRASVAVEDASGDFSVAAVWGGRFAAAFNATHFDDPRLPALGMRWLVPCALLERLMQGRVQAGEAVQVDASEYHAHRIALGIPEGGKDYALGDTFPHEANFDLLGGISFTKGCFVGQEVVSRMQHRGKGPNASSSSRLTARCSRARRSSPARQPSALSARWRGSAPWRSCASIGRRRREPKASRSPLAV